MIVRFQRWFVLALLVCLVLTLGGPSLADPAAPAAPEGISAPAYTGCGGEQPAVTNVGFEEQLVELTNDERANNGLPPLKRNANLDFAARYIATDMAQDNYTPADHKTYDRVGASLVAQCEWSDRVKLYYNPYLRLAENLAWGQTTPQAAVNWWMNSPLHRDNILSSEVWEIGVGYAANQGGAGPYWAQDFGRQTGIYPVIIDGEAAETSSRMVPIYIYGTWDQMRIKNVGGDWGAWSTFNNQTYWTLSAGDGQKIVCVQMRTGTGTPVESCDTITLDTGTQPPPTVKTKVYLPFVTRSYGGSASGWQVIMEDDFDSQVSVPWHGKDKGSGPGNYLWDFTDCRAMSGKYSVWAVANHAEGADLPCFADYPNNVETWLYYGPFSLADATKAELRFQAFVNCQPNYKDFFFYGASKDGNLYEGYWMSGASPGWLGEVFDLTSVPNLGDLTGRSQVWIGFAFVSDGSVTYPEGALVDDVVLRKYVGAAAQSMPGEYLTSATNQDWAEAGISISEKTLER